MQCAPQTDAVSQLCQAALSVANGDRRVTSCECRATTFPDFVPIITNNIQLHCRLLHHTRATEINSSGRHDAHLQLQAFKIISKLHTSKQKMLNADVFTDREISWPKYDTS